MECNDNSGQNRKRAESDLEVGLNDSASSKMSHLEAVAPPLSPDGKWIGGLNPLADASAKDTPVWILSFSDDLTKGTVR